MEFSNRSHSNFHPFRASQWYSQSTIFLSKFEGFQRFFCFLMQNLHHCGLDIDYIMILKLLFHSSMIIGYKLQWMWSIIFFYQTNSIGYNCRRHCIMSLLYEWYHINTTWMTESIQLFKKWFLIIYHISYFNKTQIAIIVLNKLGATRIMVNS